MKSLQIQEETIETIKWLYRQTKIKTRNKDVYIGNCILNVHNLIDAEKRATRDKDSNKGVESAVAINKLFN